MRPNCSLRGCPASLTSPSISRNARHHGACEDLPIQYVDLVLEHEWDCIQSSKIHVQMPGAVQKAVTFKPRDTWIHRAQR